MAASRSKTANVAFSALFLLVAPGTFAGFVPWLISSWHWGPAFFGIDILRWVGAALIAAGVFALIDSFARFAVQGLGTPAPPMPPRRLVITGAYRYVRNPMYLANLAVVVGQALLLGNPRLLVYAAIAAILVHVFVIGYEEPTLRRKFGAEYTAMCLNVPRWFPRLTPWSG